MGFSYNTFENEDLDEEIESEKIYLLQFTLMLKDWFLIQMELY